MKVAWIILILPSLALSSYRPHEDPCRCKDKRADYRYRSIEKHSTHFSQYPEAKGTTTCKDIIAWQHRYSTTMKRLSSRSLRAARVKGTPEDSLYTLVGSMYFVRHESQKNGDCDLHIEIGTMDPSEMRAIVEVTNDNCDLQKMILDHIASKGYSPNEEFTAGLPCVVKGLGFCDFHQKPFEHGRPGKTNVSSWELHPVLSIQFK